ncbi:M20/M25/M40 family metallo-hydrolase [Actinoallomurus rhizosphaericola]|uniref:M20/M25/M40 family metallo-hydrolase n=1 Tax=Actinoallomurus rhizosphaericola TaxID=2952536 RepID=UPI002093E91B|nr:M20/M25/M40 family metallo-hydrolase [Actinoallomurus rhizosphaericola]MCO5999756.1 M20/M25/M40 family metallo-hydrolase [Actinoallomurus rhizosphaericola]
MTPDLAAALTGATARLLGFGRARLREYALAESPSGDAAALARCAALIEAGHREAGGTVAREGEHLVSRFGPEDGPHLLLVGHYDTVWPVGRLDTMPYTDDGTTITGPGTYDMKGGLVAVEMALRALREAGTAPARQVRLVVVADEEVGSPTGGAVVERHLDGAVAVLGLESPHPDGALKNARRGSVRLRLGVRGREAHAALDPGKGVSAVDELIDQLAVARGVVPADGSTLFNIGRIEGGRRANVVAGEASAEIGLRFASAEAERTVLDALAALEPVRAGAAVEATVLSARPTWPERPGDPLLDHVAGVGRLLGLRIIGRPAAGAGDTNLPGSRGLPTLDGFGPPGRGAHAADEAIRVSGLAERAALLAGIMAFPPDDVTGDRG